MKKENLDKPTNQPQQSRGKQTVSYILTAAEILLKESGLKNFTTNKIAEKAGFSVASLYQFFPNKEIIFKEILDKVFAERLHRIKEILHKDIGRDEVAYEETISELANFVIQNDFSSESVVPLLYYHAVKLDLEKEIDKNELQFIEEIVETIRLLEKNIESTTIRKRILLLTSCLRGLLYLTLNSNSGINEEELNNEVKQLFNHFFNQNIVRPS